MENCDCQAVSELVLNVSQCLAACGEILAPQQSINVYYVLLPFLVVYAVTIYLIYRRISAPKSDQNEQLKSEETDNDNTNEEAETDFDASELIVFGMTGRKRSGKDTSGERLVKEHGFVRIAFADALKEACIHIFGFSRDQVYGDDLKEVVDDYWQYSPREVLQKVGTELFREGISQDHVLPDIGKNIWVRTVERKILNMAQKGHRRFVITDVRFPNELAFLKDSQFNAHSIKVVRQAVMNETDPSKLHASEAAIDGFQCDFEIQNDATIGDLHTAIDHIVRMTENGALIESGFHDKEE